MLLRCRRSCITATPPVHQRPFRICVTANTMPAKTIVGVMGPDKDPAVLPLAEQLGKALAEAGYVVLTGGRSRGVMDAASRGAKSAGGLTVGVVPGPSTEEMSEHVDIPIITGLGSARDNINALSASVLVAVGMGPGTAAEVALALKAGKHVVLLASTEEAHKFFAQLAPAHTHVAADVAAVMTHVSNVLGAQK